MTRKYKVREQCSFDQITFMKEKRRRYMFAKKIHFIVVSVIILTLLASCGGASPATQPSSGGGGDKITIGVTMKFDDLWLTTLRDAMSDYAATQPDVELVMVDSKEDVATQLAQVEN